MSQVCAMKLTESMNVCCFAVQVSCIVKVNIKETFMENNPFLQMLFGECTAVRE